MKKFIYGFIISTVVLFFCYYFFAFNQTVDVQIINNDKNTFKTQNVSIDWYCSDLTLDSRVFLWNKTIPISSDQIILPNQYGENFLILNDGESCVFLRFFNKGDNPDVNIKIVEGEKGDKYQLLVNNELYMEDIKSENCIKEINQISDIIIDWR